MTVFEQFSCLKILKKGFVDNQFHNILRFLDVLPNFLFTTTETMFDYYL